MARPSALPDGASVRIRLYRPEDHDQVIKIFSQSVNGLAQAGVQELVHNSRRLQLLACALPAAALVMTPRSCNFATKAVSGLGAAAVVPLIIYSMLRRTLKRYVTRSVTEDLSNIERFYSAAGAGQGSAFWVAELVEVVVPIGLAQQSAASEPRTARQAVGASFQQELTTVPPTIPTAAPEEIATATTPVEPTILPLVPLLAPAVVAALIDGKDEQAPADQADGSTLDNSYASETDESKVRSLVAGLVAAAISKFEATTAVAAEPTAGLDTSEMPAGVHAAAVGTAAVTPVTPAVALQSADASVQTADKQAASTTVDTTASTGSLPKLDPGSEKAAVPRSPGRPAVPAVAPSGPSVRARAAVHSVVVGYVALERKSWQVAEVRRMGVAQEYCAAGIDGMLLEALVQAARDNGFRELVLQTSGLQPAARQLCEKGGWVESMVARERGIDVYTFGLDLTKKR